MGSVSEAGQRQSFEDRVKMARGKKPPDPRNDSDVDLLAFLDVIEAYAGGADLEPDCSLNQMTAVSFARVAEAAVYQHRASLPNGRVGEYAERAQRLVKNALVEGGFSAGVRWALSHVPSLEATEAVKLKEAIDTQDEEFRRSAARHCALILNEIAAFMRRKGVKGRPHARSAADKLALWDSIALNDAVAMVAPGKENDWPAISAQIPAVVRNYLRLGQLPWRGETLQDCVDIHTERIRRHLEALPTTTRSFRGFSIKRRDT